MAKNSNNVKINLGTINNESMEKLSAFHYAIMELRRLRTEKRSAIEKIEKQIEELKESRKKALEQGESVEEVVVKYDILPLTNQISAIEEQFKKDCEPHNKSRKSAMDLIPSDIYYAYLLVMENGNPSAKGTVVTKRDKDGKVKETVKVEKTMNALITDFANTIGLGNAENESAITKFATIMATRTNGMIKANKGEDYIKVKSESQYKEIFMLSFLQYAIIEKKVIIVQEDNTLVMRDFSQNA